MALSESDFNEIRSILKREPTDVETSVFDAMWSEHCSYKSSKPLLKTLPTTGSDVVLGVGEDSGIIHFTTHNNERYGVAVSHESHNHPSQVLPIEGAATGVGGVVRDVYCMGADVFGVLDSLHFGDPRTTESDIVTDVAHEVVLGVSDYGNSLGVPVLGGETLYHSSYNENCLVNVAALGILKESDIIRSRAPKEAATEPYDVILIGKSTDSTGFGGASFSSAVLDQDDEISNAGAVQIHDPFLKRVIVVAIKHLLDIVNERQIPIGFKDLGAGGIACAASELAVSGGFGVDIELDKVPISSSELAPHIIACSETQERFCLMVPRTFSEEVLHIFNEQYELPHIYHRAGAAIIGEVTHSDTFIMRFNGEMVCDLDVRAITTDVKADRHADPRPIPKTSDQTPTYDPTSLSPLCVQMLSDLNSVSKRYVYRYYDQAVRGDTVVYPGEADAVVVTPIKGCDAAVAVSIDSNLYGQHDPYVAGAGAVAESVRNIIAVGAEPIALTDCLNYGNPENASVFFDFQEGIRGIKEAAIGLSFNAPDPIPIISGNVSFYNESKSGRAVVPSPVICAVGRMSAYQNALRMQFEHPNAAIILVGARYPEFAGTIVSQYTTQFSISGLSDVAPQVRIEDEHQFQKGVYTLIQTQGVHACHDISSGGLWVSLCDMILGERGLSHVGASLSIPLDWCPFTTLFSENGGFLMAVDHDQYSKFCDACDGFSLPYYRLGQTEKEQTLSLSHGETPIFDMPIQVLKDASNLQNKQKLGTPVWDT